MQLKIIYLTCAILFILTDVLLAHFKVRSRRMKSTIISLKYTNAFFFGFTLFEGLNLSQIWAEVLFLLGAIALTISGYFVYKK